MPEPFDLYSSVPEYDLGIDLATSDGEFGGDLILLGSKEDYGVDFGRTNLKYAIRRRLSTPQGFLKRFIRDYEGLYTINNTYGNPAYRYLSEPIGPSILLNLKSEVMACLQEEDRIEVTDVGISFVPYQGLPRVSLTISYIEKGLNELSSVVLTQGESGFIFG